MFDTEDLKHFIKIAALPTTFLQENEERLPATDIGNGYRLMRCYPKKTVVDNF